MGFMVSIHSHSHPHTHVAIAIVSDFKPGNFRHVIILPYRDCCNFLLLTSSFYAAIKSWIFVQLINFISHHFIVYFNFYGIPKLRN